MEEMRGESTEGPVSWKSAWRLLVWTVHADGGGVGGVGGVVGWAGGRVVDVLDAWVDAWVSWSAVVVVVPIVVVVVLVDCLRVVDLVDKPLSIRVCFVALERVCDVGIVCVCIHTYTQYTIRTQ